MMQRVPQGRKVGIVVIAEELERITQL